MSEKRDELAMRLYLMMVDGPGRIDDPPEDEQMKNFAYASFVIANYWEAERLRRLEKESS